MNRTVGTPAPVSGVADVPAWGRAAGWAGVAGLYVFAASGGAYKPTIVVGCGLMAVAFLASVHRAWPVLRREPLLWIALAFGLYTVLRAGLATREFPQATEAIWHGALASLALSGLGSIVTAWWLSEDERRITRTLLLATGGLFVGILANFHWADIEIYMHGARLTNISLGANGPGLYTMSAIIGLLTLGFPGILHIHERRRRYALFVLAAVVLAVMGVVFVWNQARSAWVGAAVVLPVVTVALIRQPSSRRVGMIMGAALVLLAVVVLANADIVAQRLDQEHHVMKMLAEGNIADVPYETAIGERVHIWEEGVRRVTMRPLFGWGPGTAGILSRQPGVVTARPFEHFHDIFLQIWVELGLVGLILFVSVWVLMAGKLVRAYRSGWAPPGYAFFAGGVLALFTMVTLVDIRHDDGHGMFFVVFLGGLLLVHWLRRARRSGVIAAAPASPKDAQEPGGLPGRAGGPCEPCNAAQGRLRPTQRCLTMSCARWAME